VGTKPSIPHLESWHRCFSSAEIHLYVNEPSRKLKHAHIKRKETVRAPHYSQRVLSEVGQSHC